MHCWAFKAEKVFSGSYCGQHPEWGLHLQVSAEVFRFSGEPTSHAK